MKKTILTLIVSTLLLVSCGNSKKEDAPKKETPVVVKKVATKGDAVKGKKLFGSKGCIACHNEATKIIGPAVKDIASVYAEKEGDVLSFLKGTSEAIVETDPTQVAIMKSNIDTMVKEISDADLVDIVAYINSVK